MAHDVLSAERRVGTQQCFDNVSQDLVLNRFVRNLVGPFQFDANGEIVATGSITIAGLTGMPCPPMKWHKLNDAPVSVNKKVRGDFELINFCEKGMSFGIECVGEQLVYPITPEFARRKTDIVDYDQLR